LQIHVCLLPQLSCLVEQELLRPGSEALLTVHRVQDALALESRVLYIVSHVKLVGLVHRVAALGGPTRDRRLAEVRWAAASALAGRLSEASRLQCGGCAGTVLRSFGAHGYNAAVPRRHHTCCVPPVPSPT
jgi:hypothetical protein